MGEALDPKAEQVRAVGEKSRRGAVGWAPSEDPVTALRQALVEIEAHQQPCPDLVFFQPPLQILMLNNGCLCCTVRDDLVAMLEQLVRWGAVAGCAASRAGLRVTSGMSRQLTFVFF